MGGHGPKLDMLIQKCEENDVYPVSLGYGMDKDELLPLNPIGLVPIWDMMVPKAESAAKLLNLPLNDPKSSHLRRNKFMMHQRLKEDNIACNNQIYIDTIKSLTKAKNKIKYPVVMKPEMGAASNSVF